MSIPLTLTALERTLDAAKMCCRLAWMNDVVFTMSISAYLVPRVLNVSASTSRLSECKLLEIGVAPRKWEPHAPPQA
jgi:hypothetical protein